MNSETIKKYTQSISKQHVIYTIGSIVILLFVFKAGEIVGFHKATFAFRGGDNYYRAFENKKGMMPPQFPDAHGAAGKVVSVSPTSLVVADRDGTEKTILVNADTSIRRAKDIQNLSDIAIGDMVIILGSPNTEGQIGAKLIRIMPPLPNTNNSPRPSIN